MASATPVMLRDHFAIRSITKSFVVTIILQLVARSRGSLSLDDPISRYLHGIPNGEKITLRELGNMTSGLYDYIGDAAFSAGRSGVAFTETKQVAHLGSKLKDYLLECRNNVCRL